MKFGTLGSKFSLLLALIWLVGGSATIFTLSKHLNAQAEQTTRERAEIVLTAMQAARNYTQNNIQPLVESHLALNASTEASTTATQDERFRQEIIPNFAARSIFADFRAQDPSFLAYLYKEAAVNPTNTVDDLADTFEAQLFPQMQPLTEEPPQTLSGYRTLDNRKLFYLAQPLVMKDASCLGCHGNPQDAPQPLLDMYGDRNGFGWQLNEIVATQMVYVPADMIFARGRQNLWTVAKTFLSIFGALFITINLLLWQTVIRPLNILTGTAKQIGECAIANPSQISSASSATASTTSAANAPDPTETTTPSQKQALAALSTRKDEPGQMARAFEYMLYVLGQREQDLHIAVEAKTRSLRQEMRDRQTAQSALQIYAHAMNHDLRNVVMGISSVVQGILFRAKGTDCTGEVMVEAEAIALIQQSCDRQLQLMNSLMEVRSADVWRTALKPAPVDLHSLATALVTTYRSKFGERTHSVTFTNQIPVNLPLVQADKSQIQRVFENLMNNAVKYNPDGVVVTVSAAVHQDNHGTCVRCTVTDNGKGIEPAKRANLFAPYTRGKHQGTPGNNATGYGLGLYICKEIVVAHGGTMGVEAPPATTSEQAENRGAAFWFTLPVSIAT